MKIDLHRTIAESKRQVRDLKKSVPYIFPEYLHLIDCENALGSAKKDLAKARKQWKKLGKDI